METILELKISYKFAIFKTFKKVLKTFVYGTKFLNVGFVGFVGDTLVTIKDEEKSVQAGAIVLRQKDGNWVVIT